MGTKARQIYSESLNKQVELTGDAKEFYEISMESRLKDAPKDPAYYVELVNLGYSYTRNSIILNHGFPTSIKKIVDYKISPDMVNYIGDKLHIGETDYFSQSTWLGEAISQVTPEEVEEVTLRGWWMHLAIIIAAFPEKESRLEQVFDYGLEGEREYLYSDYNVPMLARLDRLPSAKPDLIIKALENEYTESEIGDYGFILPQHFASEDLRASTASIPALKAVFNVFKDNLKYKKRHLRFIPTIAQLEAIIASGIIKGSDYKHMGRMLSMETTWSLLAESVPKVLSLVSYEDLQKIYAEVGPIEDVEEFLFIAQMLKNDDIAEGYITIAKASRQVAKMVFQLDVDNSAEIIEIIREKIEEANTSSKMKPEK